MIEENPHHVNNKSSFDFSKKKKDQIKKRQEKEDNDNKNKTLNRHKNSVLGTEQDNLNATPLKVQDRIMDCPKYPSTLNTDPIISNFDLNLNDEYRVIHYQDELDKETLLVKDIEEEEVISDHLIKAFRSILESDIEEEAQ